MRPCPTPSVVPQTTRRRPDRPAARPPQGPPRADLAPTWARPSSGTHFFLSPHHLLHRLCAAVLRRDAALAVISSFLLFGVGFIARPIGRCSRGTSGPAGPAHHPRSRSWPTGVLHADRALPRRRDRVGIAAPILLAVLRCVQGMAAGGEWGGATLMACGERPRGQARVDGLVVQLGSPTGTILLDDRGRRGGAVRRRVSGGCLAHPVPDLHPAGGRGRVDPAARGRDRRLQGCPGRTHAPQEKEGLPAVEILRTVPGRLILGVGTYLFGNAGFFAPTTFMISYVTGELWPPP
ncbi:hypothetical protein QJS66_13385 [Kocuria rhizophila]|nr:hypothetical protein QJS66_13385 [Kocuria rhizophila]